MAKEKQTDEILLAKLDRMWNEASEARKQQDWKWYMYGMWVRGYHYARYDQRTRQIVGKPASDGRPQITINKIYPTLRAVRNYALRNQPKAQVTPEKLSMDNLDQALKATKFLDFIHETKKLRPKLKGTVFQALETSLSWWQIIWNGKEIDINPVDCFDFYYDPKAKTNTEMRYGILAVSRRIKDLMEDDKYDKNALKDIKPDNKQSASSYKELLLQYDQQGQQTGNTNNNDGTVIVKEHWYREGEATYVCAVAGGRLIRKPELVDTPIIPFFKLASDLMPFSMTGEGWVKGMIDPQKMINSAASSLAEYNLVMNKVKIVVDKGAGVRSWNNQHGQFIEKKKGYEATTQSVAPMNNAIFQQLEYSTRFIEDIGAMHDAMMGRVPAGAKSGRAIESLQIGDSNNMSELVENIEDFLEDVYEYVLFLASKKYQDMKDVVVMDYTGQREFLKVIGTESPVAQEMVSGGNVPDDVLIVSPKNMVDVKISSYLSFTPEGKRESVKELMGLLPDLPEDVVLDAFGVGNIAEVVKKIKEKREEEKTQALEQEAMASEQQQEIQNPSSNGQEAIAAIRTIIQGGTPQVPNKPGQDYVQVIDQFLEREQQMGELEPGILQAIQTFRDQIVQGAGVR